MLLSHGRPPLARRFLAGEREGDLFVQLPRGIEAGKGPQMRRGEIFCVAVRDGRIEKASTKTGAA